MPNHVPKYLKVRGPRTKVHPSVRKAVNKLAKKKLRSEAKIRRNALIGELEARKVQLEKKAADLQQREGALVQEEEDRDARRALINGQLIPGKQRLLEQLQKQIDDLGGKGDEVDSSELEQEASPVLQTSAASAASRVDPPPFSELTIGQLESANQTVLARISEKYSELAQTEGDEEIRQLKAQIASDTAQKKQIELVLAAKERVLQKRKTALEALREEAKSTRAEIAELDHEAKFVANRLTQLGYELIDVRRNLSTAKADAGRAKVVFDREKAKSKTRVDAEYEKAVRASLENQSTELKLVRKRLGRTLQNDFLTLIASNETLYSLALNKAVTAVMKEPGNV